MCNSFCPGIMVRDTPEAWSVACKLPLGCVGEPNLKQRHRSMKRQRRDKPGTNSVDSSNLPVKKARVKPAEAWLSGVVDNRRDAALSLKDPLYVVHLVYPKCTYQPTLRHLSFQLKGLEEFAQDLLDHNIGFHCIPIVATGEDASMQEASAAARTLLEKLDPSVLVCDLMPLRLPVPQMMLLPAVVRICFILPRRPTQLIERVADLCLRNQCPLYQVDAHNVVPVWLASSVGMNYDEKQLSLESECFIVTFPAPPAAAFMRAHLVLTCVERFQYSARTFRPHVLGFLSEFAGNIPRMQKHPHECQPNGTEKFKMSSILSKLKYDESVVLPKQWIPGTKAGFAALHEFCTKPRLSGYASRNNPAVAGQSGLSPWLHFGQLSIQRCVSNVRKLGPAANLGAAAAAMRDSFIEELVVRRELAENFIFYNAKYDKVEGAHRWAQDTLAAHQRDRREHIYTLAEFEAAKTHDELWNAAQLQLVQEAKMHGFLRMYWAKKILEWTRSPESALEISLFLNDKYSLDGTDPNGVVGCMWSIAGVHDQGWGERPVFGKIRFMNLAGCRRKFPVDAFVKRFPSTTRMPVNELLAKKSKLTKPKVEPSKA
ncbi:hypothetical protein Esti_002793 [Eimeria stiedai]